MKPIRDRKRDNNLLLATWNIRDFDSNKYEWGPRLEETFYYLAEMISAFDFVAIQEVNRDLEPLRKLVGILGREWDYLVTDVTEGWSGNDERMAYVFNTEKVWFRKIAGEIVLPRWKKKKDTDEDKGKEKVKDKGWFDDKIEVKRQFARSPYLVAFQSGWFKFSLCTVHIYFGEDSGPKLKRRVEEIKRLMEFFAERQDDENKQTKDRLGNVENYILLGDFNVVSPEHETMEALKSEGFEVPSDIDGRKVRDDDPGEQDHFYDQIAVRVKDPRFRVGDGGMVDMFDDVFRMEEREIYAAKVPKEDPEKNPKYKVKTPEAIYRKWRSWQMSDHKPLWIEIKTDYSEHYLRELVEENSS